MDNNKYKGIYRSESTRLQKWDYGWNAIYFVTICTKDRQHYFGEITDGKMHLSPVGAIADVLWHELTNHFDNIELDAFVVMPNHIHGIIAINNVDNGNNVGNRTTTVGATVAITITITVAITTTQNHRATTISTSGVENIIIHCRFIQIRGFTACAPIGIRFFMAIPFL